MMSPAPAGQDHARYAAQLVSAVIGDVTGSRLFYALVDPAIADEAHQSLFPTRSASLGDVFLDLVGIALAIFLASYKMTRKCTPSGPQGGNGSRAPD